MGLATQYRALAQQYNELVDKHNQLIDRYKAVLQEKVNECSLEPDKITYERFCRELRLKFAFDKMPDKSGIYAYRNTRTHDIYVGQSVNMKKRLVQHFRNGKTKNTGHDSEFKDPNEWEFYVLEYIHRDKTDKLNEREAYWICLARAATANKRIVDRQKAKQVLQQFVNNEQISVQDVSTTKVEKGTATNRTKGNNLKR